MQAPSAHPKEPQRLAVLRSYQILDTLPEAVFDDLTKLAAHICDVPMATISLVDQDRQWFKSAIGIGAPETPREVSFCGHAILGNGLMEVSDTHQDKRFADNPIVTDGPKIRFYAGAPLTDVSGMPLGTLCVVDSKPRSLSVEQREALNALARLVVHQLEIRKTNLGLQDLMVKFSGEDPAKKERLAALGQLSGGVAHEINNPLTIIHGMIEILGMKIRREQNVEHELEALKKATQRVAQVVTGLKNFAQQRTLTSLKPLAMQDLFKKLQTRFETLAQTANVTILWPEDEIARVNVDEAQIFMAIEHVIKNAVEAASASADRVVKIESHVDDGFWALRCTDTGSGITTENLQRLFEPFFTTKPTGSGQGLGLSVARGIIMAHGGSVDLVQQNPTVFEIRLP